MIPEKVHSLRFRITMLGMIIKDTSSKKFRTAINNHRRITESKQSGDCGLRPSASSYEDVEFEIVETASPVHL